MAGMSRRAFVRRMTAATAATWGASLWQPGLRLARAQTAGMVTDPSGTTLAMTFAPAGEGLYVKLTTAPGWPVTIREDLASGVAGREDRRTALASIAHLTDIHLIDVQSPTRVEFLDRDADPPQQQIPFSSAFRAQESVTCQVGDAMLQQFRTLNGGPVTGRPFDVAVSTGDNIDNQQRNELTWFLALLNGGEEITPNSGDLTRYEGVQDTDTTTYDEHYYHPDEVGHAVSGEPDLYKRRDGFPSYPGFLEAAIQPFMPVGIGIPWYSCYGNHDGLLSGNVPSNVALDAIATGPFKVTSRPGLTTGDIQFGLGQQDPTVLGALFSGPGRMVTPDPERTFLTPADWVQMHMDATGPGPVGHGYTQHHLDTGELYYTFPIAPGVLGICLDTTNRGGYAEGSIGQAQMDWLEERLIEVSSRYFDAAGGEMSTTNDDQLVVLFSHHNIATLENPFPDPAIPSDERILGDAVTAFVHRFPNVVLWVNGHSHVNRVWSHVDPLGQSGGFWEVNTAAHCDSPEQARTVELVDNNDGTLSIFGILVDHAGPASGAVDGGVLDLAAISRELAFNDNQLDPAASLGTIEDRNVELIIARPFAPAVAAPPPAPPPAPAPGPAPERPLPATGGGLAMGAIAIAGAAALAHRSSAERTDGS